MFQYQQLLSTSIQNGSAVIINGNFNKLGDFAVDRASSLVVSEDSFTDEGSSG